VFHEVEKHELERLKGLDVPAINQWLEAHMNREEQPNYYVPIRPSLAAAFLPEPQPEDQRHAQHVRELNRAMTMIAPEARSRFLACLHRLHPNSGRRVESVLSEPAQSDTPTLSQILNIDSVDAVELTTALQLEFSNQAKAPIFDGPVHEVLVTAAGLQIQDLAPGLSQTQPVDVRWFRPPPPQYSGQPADCLLEQFLRLAHGSPESAWIANGDGQMLTYREGLAMILVRASEISNFDKNSSLRLAMQSRVETAIDVLATLLVGREFVLGAADLPGAKPFDWSWGEGPSLGRARFQFLWPRVKWDKKRSPKAYRLEGEELFYAKIFEAGQRMLHDVQNEKKNGVLIHLKVESKSKAQSEVSLQEQWISLLAPLAVGLRAVYVDGAHTSDELTELARAFDVVAPRPRH
jgi:hypothetical protein